MGQPLWFRRRHREQVPPCFVIDRPTVDQYVPIFSVASFQTIEGVVRLFMICHDPATVPVRSFRPLNQESRDIGQFMDDDGSAYLIFESRPAGGFFIAPLSDDYLDIKQQVSFIHEPLEGGALVHYKGLYYVLDSHMTGWAPIPTSMQQPTPFVVRGRSSRALLLRKRIPIRRSRPRY
jgi:hypothetical protein